MTVVFILWVDSPTQHNHETSLWVGLISRNDYQNYQPEWAQRKNLKPSRINSFCLTTNPLPLAKRVLHRERSSASSFGLQHPLLLLRIPNSCLPLLPRLPLTYIPSITRFRRQFLCKMWPNQLAFLLFLLFVRYSSPPDPKYLQRSETRICSNRHDATYEQQDSVTSYIHFTKALFTFYVWRIHGTRVNAILLRPYVKNGLPCADFRETIRLTCIMFRSFIPNCSQIWQNKSGKYGYKFIYDSQ